MSLKASWKFTDTHTVKKLCAAVLALTTMQPALAQHTPEQGTRNVILIIGDGFDDQHVTMGRNYLKGNDGELLLDAMPVRGAVQIETVDTEGNPVYVADSANTASTLATGVVTNIGRIATDRHDKDHPTIAEMANAAGFAVGIVSTASVTDATPAAFLSHVSNRGCENADIIKGGMRYGEQYAGCPQDAVSNGGPGSISEQIAQSNADVVLGGGAKHFAIVTEAGTTPAENAKHSQFTLANNRAELMAATSDNKRLLGLFSKSTMAPIWRGTDGRKAESMVQDDGTQVTPEPMKCEPNPKAEGLPTLPEMTRVAIDKLQRRSERGFFLMVESASIDKESHSRNPCGSIGEVLQLEQALELAQDFAEKNPQTLIIVTADHAQAAQIIPEPSLFESDSRHVLAPGKIARVITPEGSIMRVNYATNDFAAEEHTGANVPLFSNAIGAQWLKPFMRQRELHDAMLQFLNLKPKSPIE